jgi:hypothetical protein
MGEASGETSFFCAKQEAPVEAESTPALNVVPLGKAAKAQKHHKKRPLKNAACAGGSTGRQDVPPQVRA